MSNNIWNTIIPTSTSGTQLAGYLNAFKDAVVSGFSGTARPSQLQAGGYWIDLTNDASGKWDFKIYDGSQDITVFTIDKVTGRASIAGSASTFEIVKTSSDSTGPILKLIKERLLGLGQTLSNDELGKIEFRGTQDDGAETTQARISAVATQDTSSTAQGADLVFEQVDKNSAALLEKMRLQDGKLGIGTNSPTEKLDVRGNITVQKISDDTLPAIKKTKKKRLTGSGQVIGGDSIAQELYQSTNNLGTEIDVVKVEVKATESHTATEHGASYTISTKNNGSDTFTEQVRIDSTGVDIPNLKVGTVSNTEIGYLDGVTSPIQNQINTLSANITTAESAANTYTDNKITALVNASPATLDTLGELADALGDDPNFATTMATSLGNRLRVDTDTQGLSLAQKTNAKTNIDLQNVKNLDQTDPSNIVQDATHRFVTDTEKSTWNAKQNALVAGTDYTTPAGTESLTNKTIIGASIQNPSKLDAKKDTKANLITYASTAGNGELLYATDTKTYHGIKDGQLVDIGGGSGVGGVDILFTDTAEAANLTDYTQTGLEISETPITIHATKSFRFVHASGSEKNMKSVKAVDRKFRGKIATFSMDVVATTTSGNATILFRDETNNADIGTAQVISTGSSAITATTANASNAMVLSDRAVFNTLQVGMLVTGSAIPNGTVINSLDSATMTATLSQNATGVATGIRVSSLTTRRDFSITIPANCASISYTVKALAEANNAAMYFDDVVFQLAEYAKTSTAITVPKNNNYSGTIVNSITIGATTSAPTKGTLVTDRIVTSRVENRLIAEFQFEQSSGGAAGTGDYLFTLPAGMSFDSGSVIFSTGSYGANSQKSVIGFGTISNGTTNSYPVIAIAYDSNKFRLVAGYNGGSPTIVGSGHFPLSTSLGFSVHVDAPISGWTANETETKNISLTSSVLVTQPDACFRMAGFQTLRKTGATSALYLSGGTIHQNVGSAITVINSATDGLKIVANVSGSYFIQYQQNATSTATTPAFYKGVLDATNESARVTMFGYDLASGGIAHISGTVFLEKDEFITLQGDTTSTDTSYGFLSVSYSGSIKQINPSVDQKIDIPTHELRFEGCSANGTGVESATAQFTSLTKIKGDGLEVSNSNGTIITVKKKGILTVTTNITQGDRYLSKNQVVNTTYPTSSERLTRSYQNTTYVAPMGWSGPVEIGDKIRVNGDAPSGTTANTLSMTLIETSVAVALQNVTPQFDNSDSALRVYTANGFGSTNTTVRRFTNVSDNIGTDLIFTDSATLGTYVTIQKDGLYSISATDACGASSSAFFVTKNSTTNSAASNLLTVTCNASTAANGCGEFPLLKGDVIRVVAETPANFISGYANASLVIARTGKTSGTVDVTPFVNIPQNEVEAIEAMTATSTWGSVNTGVPVLNVTRNTNKGVIQVISDSSSGTSFKALKDCSVSISARLVNNLASESTPGITRNATLLTSSGFDGELVSETLNTSGGYVNLSTNVVLSAGDVLRVQRANTNITSVGKVTLTAVAVSNSITTQTQQVSSDSITFTFKSTAIDTNSDPIGTFNWYQYAANSNTPTLQSSAPSQSVTDMSTNGIRVYCKPFPSSPVAGQPNRVQIFIGKGLDNVNRAYFQNAGKSVSGNLENAGLVSSNTWVGVHTYSYNRTTGIVTIDLGYNESSAITTYTLRFEDETTNPNAYFWFSASKTPSLVTIPNTQPKKAVLSYKLASGVAPANATANTYTARILNSLVDPSGIVSNPSAFTGVGGTNTQFILPAGTYTISGVATLYQNIGAVEFRSRLRNVTDGLTMVQGSGDRCGTTGFALYSSFSETITIAATKTFEFQDFATSTTQRGLQASAGDVETFGYVEIEKIK